MDTTTTETGASTETGAGDGEKVVTDEMVSVSKKDYETMNQTLGSLKREIKDLKKPKDTDVETPTKTKSDNFGLVEKTFLRSAGIVDAEEVELARVTAKKWGVGIDEVVDDEDFKVKLERHRTTKSNEAATSNIKGSQGQSQAKNSPEYWQRLGKMPTREDVPDRKTRATITRQLMKNAQTGGKKFYND